MIVRHIADLLFHHECVIVPGLGGFIKAHRPARIVHSTHEFCPPLGSVAFNSGLYINDGVLASYISTVENISYRESLHEIKQWVDINLASLKQGNKVILEGIGELILNSSEKIEFTPSKQINFNADSFGLPVFYAKEVSVETVIVPEIQTVSRTGRTYKWRRLIPETLKWAAVLAPFIAFVLWGSIKGNIIENYVHNYTGMYSWVRSTPGKTATYTGTNSKVAVKEKTPDIVLSPAEVLAGENIQFDPAMVSYAELTKNNISITETAPEVVAEFPVENENYYIIGGAFRDQNNALKLISMLQQKGYPAAVVDTTPGGLYVVSMKGFSTLDEATNQLNEIRKDGFPSSWILKKHRG